MKKYTMSFAAVNEHVPANPERTARKTAHGFCNFDVVFQEWPNRPAMARSIRMQERSGVPNKWKACQALRETEGY